MLSSSAAISNLHWIVISIACSTRLEIFQCPERKSIKKTEEKREGKNQQTWIGLQRHSRPPS